MELKKETKQKNRNWNYAKEDVFNSKWDTGKKQIWDLKHKPKEIIHNEAQKKQKTH